MIQLIRKGLFMAAVYIVLQLVLMALIWWLFQINLFETAKSPRLMEDLSRTELKGLIALNQIFGLFLPALLYLILIYARKSFNQIQLSIPYRSSSFLIALGILFLSMPMIQFLTQLNALFDLNVWMEKTSVEIGNYMSEIIVMDDPVDLTINLLLIAVMPAIAEELFFRAVVQNELVKHLKNAHVGIFLTAILFSAFHFQFEGFLPRIFLGAILGYAYYYSRSFFIPVLMHFTNNAILVVVVYLNPEKLNEEISEELTVQYPVLVLSTLVLVYLFYMLKKSIPNEDK